MKRHKRCSIGGSSGNIEIPLLLSFLYLFSKAEMGLRPSVLELSREFFPGDLDLKTASGGEFDWGGTSVKR